MPFVCVVRENRGWMVKGLKVMVIGSTLIPCLRHFTMLMIWYKDQQEYGRMCFTEILMLISILMEIFIKIGKMAEIDQVFLKFWINFEK